jgi:hypothetical protein
MTFNKLINFLKYHLHVALYAYFWFGLFISALLAPEHRVVELGSSVITKGWHLALLSLILILPVPFIYYFRMFSGSKR